MDTSPGLGLTPEEINRYANWKMHHEFDFASIEKELDEFGVGVQLIFNRFRNSENKDKWDCEIFSRYGITECHSVGTTIQEALTRGLYNLREIRRRNGVTG